MLTLLAMLACGQAAVPPGHWMPRGCRDRSCWTRIGGRGGGAGGTFSPDAPFVLAVDYEWPYTGELTSICTGDSDCVALCMVGAVDGGTTSWQCIDHSGAAMGTVTDPGTAAVIDSFIMKADGGFYKALDITAASQAPNLVSTAVDAIYGQVASTTLMVGYGRTTGTVNGNHWWMDGYPGGTVGYMQMVDDVTGATEGSAGFWCATGPTNSGAAGAVNQPRDAWAIASCRTDGVNGAGNTKKIDIGLAQTTGSASLRRDMQVGTHYIFGASNARTDMINGPIALWVAFSTSKSDAFLRGIQGKIWRDYNAAGVVTPLVSATVRPDYFDHVAQTGNVDAMLNNAPMVDVQGLRTVRGHQNTWAADALATATFTAVGTPVITSNVTSGPYSVLKQAAECDLIATANVAADDGVQGLESWDAGTTTKNFTNSCYLKAGTSGTVRTKAILTWATDGTSSNPSCVVTGLTSTATRYSCTSLFSGAVTTVKPRLLVGGAIGDIGSIQACGCMNTEGPALEPPRPNNTAVPDSFYTLNPTTDAWPDFFAITGGKLEIVHTPLFDPAAVSVQPVDGDPDYLLDVDNATDVNHSTGLVFGYTGGGELLAIFRQGGNISDILTSGISLTKDHTYATATAWRSVGGGKCKLYVYHNDCGATPATSCTATTLIASDLTGTATCPATPTGAHLGNRFTETVGTSTRINSLRVYSL